MIYSEAKTPESDIQAKIRAAEDQIAALQGRPSRRPDVRAASIAKLERLIAALQNCKAA